MTKNILLIEDDKLVGITLQRLLKTRGYDVTFVNDGAAALQKVKEADFNLIISDIRMAKLDGIETIKRIRDCLENQSKESVPEVLITGYAEDDSYKEAKELKISAFLYKPFDNDKFLQTVEQILAMPAFPLERRMEPRVEAALPNVEKFFESALPDYIKEICNNNYVFEKFNQKQIMEVIDFTPPFLEVEKAVVLGLDRNDLLQNTSLATGILTAQESKGHYNDAVFLAECGWLMGQAASIYLAILFPSTAPQVVEVDHIKLSDNGILWSPAVDGSRFFIETRVVKKKLQMVVVNVRIFFGDIFICGATKLKLVLTPKDSNWAAKELPPRENSGIVEKIDKKISPGQIEGFFGVTIPEHIKKNYRDKQIYKKLNQQEIMKIVDFAPPFLRIDKMIVFDVNKDFLLQSTSLGMGVVTLQDSKGHYNDTVFLAECGWLMGVAVSVHLAVLFPLTTPEVIEAKGVKPVEKGVWKPARQGTLFWVETSILKKESQLVTMKTRISFDKIIYGIVDESKSVLIQKE